MPRWVLFLIGLIAVGALMWFIWGRTYTTSVKVFPPIGGTAPQSAAEAIYEKVIEQPAQEAIGFIKSIPERINQAAQDVVKQAEQQAREKAAEAILGQDIIQTSPAGGTTTAGGTPASGNNSTSQFDICLAQPKSREVSYIVENPFPTTTGASYAVDWGDGKTLSGKFQSGEKEITVSHIYTNIGTFTAAFKVHNDGTTLTAERRTCTE
ncbi:MAG: PKD domain-containing protein [Patescibacteria group bacterium]